MFWANFAVCQLIDLDGCKFGVEGRFFELKVDKKGFVWHIECNLGLVDFIVIYGNMIFLVKL